MSVMEVLRAEHCCKAPSMSAARGDVGHPIARTDVAIAMSVTRRNTSPRDSRIAGGDRNIRFLSARRRSERETPENSRAQDPPTRSAAHGIESIAERVKQKGVSTQRMTVGTQTGTSSASQRSRQRAETIPARAARLQPRARLQWPSRRRGPTLPRRRPPGSSHGKRTLSVSHVAIFIPRIT